MLRLSVSIKISINNQDFDKVSLLRLAELLHKNPPQLSNYYFNAKMSHFKKHV